MIIEFMLPLLLVLPLEVNAHPGRTAGDGCHYCRTNCDSWGEVWNARHCHGGGGGAYTAPTTTTTPRCPANSYRSGSSCTCNSGYAPSLNRSSCIKIPANAHKGNGITDVWECDNGYIESGNRCIKEAKETDLVEIDELVMEEEKDVDEVTLQEIEEIMEDIRKETSGLSDDDSGSLGSFLLGAVTITGGYLAYKKARKS